MTSWRVPSWPNICCTMCPAGTVSGMGIGGLELVDTIRIVAGPERNRKEALNLTVWLRRERDSFFAYQIHASRKSEKSDPTAFQSGPITVKRWVTHYISLHLSTDTASSLATLRVSLILNRFNPQQY